MEPFFYRLHGLAQKYTHPIIFKLFLVSLVLNKHFDKSNQVWPSISAQGDQNQTHTPFPIFAVFDTLGKYIGYIAHSKNYPFTFSASITSTFEYKWPPGMLPIDVD